MEQKKEELTDLEKLKEKSRGYSIKDGIFSTIKDSIASNYISPFAIAINSSNSLIAMLSSIPGLLGPMCQLLSSRLIEKYPRKKIILKAVLFETLAWIPLIIIALLYYYGIIVNLLPLMLLIFFSLYVITANMSAPAWFSWIGDLVDENKRGIWFGKRNFIFGIITFTFTISGALLLDFFKKQDLALLGFTALFLLAILSRIISRYYLSKQYEPLIKIEKENYFSFWTFIKKAPFNNFGRFTIFRALVNSSTFIAGPFFAIYMLKNLNFSYLTFITVTMSAILYSLLSVRIWGKFSDKYGNYQVFKITIVFIALIPILWVLSPSPIYLILIPQLVSGISWAGFNLASSNYFFDCVTPQKRGLAFSYSELLNGIGIFIGACIGAILIQNLTISFINPILLIFIISGILRLITGLIMLPRIKEVKSRQEFKGSLIIKNFISETIKFPFEISARFKDNESK